LTLADLDQEDLLVLKLPLPLEHRYLLEFPADQRVQQDLMDQRDQQDQGLLVHPELLPDRTLQLVQLNQLVLENLGTPALR